MTRFFWLVSGAVLAVLLVGGVLVWMFSANKAEAPIEETAATAPEVVVPETSMSVETVIGKSVEGRPIMAYTYGTGETHLLFVGGIHGGYEWNSVYLAYRMMDYLTDNSDAVPANLSVTIIPAANPDGVFKVVNTEGRFVIADVPDAPNTTGVGRFNANNVDLNRNFACKWQPTSSWKGKEVSAGTAAFSEPEAAAIRDYVEKIKPTAVVFWHSAANAVYASECTKGVLPETLAVMNTYAHAAKYNAVASFDAYPVTGDAEGWLASIGIPAVTVELSTHDTTDWERNLAGTKAILEKYRK